MNPQQLNYQLGLQAGGQVSHYRQSQHSQASGTMRVAGPQQQNLTHSQMENLRFARLDQHNLHYHTDKLYDPLRNTLVYPESIKYHEKQIPQTVRHSYLTHDYKLLTPQQAQNLRRNTFIPHDVDLAQTDHFYKVKDKQFVAVNTQTRVIGKAISPLELERLKQEGVKKSMVVYDIKQKIEEVDPVTTYTPPPIESSSYGQKEYKYNLYSMIDEPMNWVREFGCKGVKWCTPNQIIASKNQPQSLRWLK